MLALSSVWATQLPLVVVVGEHVATCWEHLMSFLKNMRIRRLRLHVCIERCIGRLCLKVKPLKPFDRSIMLELQHVPTHQIGRSPAQAMNQTIPNTWASSMM